MGYTLHGHVLVTVNHVFKCDTLLLRKKTHSLSYSFQNKQDLSPNLTGMRQLETSSRIVRDYFATKINNIDNFHVAVSLNRHLCDKFANFGLILKIYCATVARVSHDFPANVTYFHLNSYDSRAAFVRVSRDIRTSVAKILHRKFAKISRRRQVRNTRTNVARRSHDSRVTVLRNILEKKFA